MHDHINRILHEHRGEFPVFIIFISMLHKQIVSLITIFAA